MGISDSSLCSYCQEHDETIQHLFYNCNISNTLWSELTNFFIGKITLPSLDLQSAVLGFLDTSEKNNVILNNILLMFKITLYRNRSKNTINLRNVLNNLKNREKIERYLVFENQNKLDFHMKKWGEIFDLL